ncbi:hypothetical protein H8356DRAFT_1649821 [Neocallimastix lanati (nom. inval.)]|uniref:BTB domain-containing protein n=1 Tax=Neocallimastix californiae TaxID=1754190 RepID=A0A1Y2D575_9FUNG|nr:hypothetical protein H8356DRAFT_1649821 [Neocallimastix sp. JGI-2020a]ORY54294.1 hypothetical protein LY90DRAFT_702379 [Neocallimastix californiae]|eukprot:ORY54294.1 hypothetical protein LY90DRAFT_702379 [Neocallimastix californiae]
MAYILNETYSQLPSPPLSPASLPISTSLFCNKEAELEYDDDDFDFTEKEIDYLESILGFPIERPEMQTKEEILRSKFMNMMEDGVEINGEMTPYSYAIEKLHNIGGKVINKKTMDAVQFRVYETGTEKYQEFWVHPIFLSLQSFQFFKLFEEVKENNEQGTIEIEVPYLDSFAFVLYWLYTGDNSKLLEIAKLDENFCKGIMENIELLEINMVAF